MGGGASRHHQHQPHATHAAVSAVAVSDDEDNVDDSEDSFSEEAEQHQHRRQHNRYRAPPPRQLPQSQSQPQPQPQPQLSAVRDAQAAPPLKSAVSSVSEDDEQVDACDKQRRAAVATQPVSSKKPSASGEWNLSSDSEDDESGGSDGRDDALDVYDWTQFDTTDGLATSKHSAPSSPTGASSAPHSPVKLQQRASTHTGVATLVTDRPRPSAPHILSANVHPRQPPPFATLPTAPLPPRTPPPTPPPPPPPHPPAGARSTTPHHFVRPPQLITQAALSARNAAEAKSPSAHSAGHPRAGGSPTVRVMRGTARPRSKSNEDRTVKDTTDIVCKTHNFPEVRHQPPTKGNWVSKRHVVNNYILLESLGSGSYGQVRLCKRKETDGLYAIKIISKELLKKRKAGQESTYFDDVRREIAIMKKLDHPNVVKLYEVMDDPKVNKLYLVLEYMQRKDLMQLLKLRQQLAAQEEAAAAAAAAEGGSASTTNPQPQQSARPISTPWLNDQEVLRVFQQVVAGLHYLHSQNIIHGDIKPQNLLMDEDSTVKIADFGISKMLDTSTEQLKDTAGTPVFMAPEVCRGEEYSGQLADMWALGGTMYMLRMGHPPFVASNATALYYKIENDPVTFPQPLCSGLRDVLVHLLEKDPAKRWSLNQLMSHPWIVCGENVVLESIQPSASSANKKTYPTIEITHDDALCSINFLEELMSTRKEYEYVSVNEDGTQSTYYTTQKKASTPVSRPRTTRSTSSSTGEMQDDIAEPLEVRRMTSEEEHRRTTSFLKMRARMPGQVPKLNYSASVGHDDRRETTSHRLPAYCIESRDDDSDGSDSSDNERCRSARYLSNNDFEALMDTLAQQPHIPSNRQHYAPLPNCNLNMSLVSVPHHQLNRATGVGICCRTTRGRRQAQQDRYNAECDLSRLPTVCARVADRLLLDYAQMSAVCVFDGHTGELCAEWLAKNALSTLAAQEGFVSATKSVCARMIPAIDQEACALLRTCDDLSGSTGIFVLYNGWTKALLVANVGDSRCVLSRGGSAVALSEDHRLTRQSEKDRVIAAGAAVAKQRVNGVLAISRSFGDVQFKSNYHGAATAAGSGAVIAQPEIKVEIVTPKTEFAVVATDGLWDVMHPQRAVNFVRQQLEQHGDLNAATKALVGEALARGSVDNITVVIMAFHLT